jgi:hypothetical protein
MNQTGELGTKKFGAAQQVAAMEINPYAEDPRPNLFNIVSNIRDNKVSYNES